MIRKITKLPETCSGSLVSLVQCGKFDVSCPFISSITRMYRFTFVLAKCIFSLAQLPSNNI